MKKVIDSTTYDTEAAVEVLTEDNQPLSEAWWGLYKTQTDVFFKVVADHDGSIREFKPVADHEARALLEKRANHLVEKYFGPQPGPAPLRFSRPTVISAIEVLEAATEYQKDLTRFLLKLSPELAERCDPGSLGDRFNHLIKAIDENPRLRAADGQLVQEVLVEAARAKLSGFGYDPTDADYASSVRGEVSFFVRALDLDGYAVRNESLIRSLPAEFDIPEAEDDVTRLLKKHGFTTPARHLDQSLAAHGRGEWEGANAQLRSFYEGLLDEMAYGLDPAAKVLQNSENRRAHLAKLGFLYEPLNEWGSDGKNFINGLFKRLHPAGSHPGLSDQDDSTFRRHTVLLTARLLLTRYDAKKTP